MTGSKKLLLFVLFISYVTVSVCKAQVGVQKVTVRSTPRRTETTSSIPITNKLTGQPITMEQYSELTKDDPFKYHLVPEYDEFGRPKSYIMRLSTAEEHETHRFRDRDPAKQPRLGQTIAPFVMTGLDGTTYRSADLLGKVVILSFWISLNKEFWTDKQKSAYTDAVSVYKSTQKPVQIAVLNSEPTKAADNPAAEKLPFVAVPNAYGFHEKYHVTGIPTIVVIDKAGKVLANLQGATVYEQLKEVLTNLR